METTEIQKRFIIIGAIAAILAAVVYPVAFYTSLSLKTNLILELFLGFSFGFVFYGLFRFIRINRDSVCLQVGMLTGILAAFTYVLKSGTFASMTTPLEGILVQGDQSFVYALTNRLYTGIHFIWEILIGAGIFSISIAFFRQPRPGKVIAAAGIIIALAIIINSIYAFPEIGRHENFSWLGIVLPVWLLIVGLLMIFSQKWIKVK